MTSGPANPPRWVDLDDDTDDESWRKTFIDSYRKPDTVSPLVSITENPPIPEDTSITEDASITEDQPVSEDQSVIEHKSVILTGLQPPHEVKEQQIEEELEQLEHQGEDACECRTSITEMESGTETGSVTETGSITEMESVTESFQTSNDEENQQKDPEGVPANFESAIPTEKKQPETALEATAVKSTLISSPKVYSEVAPNGSIEKKAANFKLVVDSRTICHLPVWQSTDGTWKRGKSPLLWVARVYDEEKPSITPNFLSFVTEARPIADQASLVEESRRGQNLKTNEVQEDVEGWKTVKSRSRRRTASVTKNEPVTKAGSEQPEAAQPPAKQRRKRDSGAARRQKKKNDSKKKKKQAALKKDIKMSEVRKREIERLQATRRQADEEDSMRYRQCFIGCIILIFALFFFVAYQYLNL